MRLFKLFIVSALLAMLCSSARSAEDDRIRVATWNLEWFFDDDTSNNLSDVARRKSAPSREEWQWKLSSVARVIAKMRPTILGLQEVESRDVLLQLTQVLKDEHNISYRVAFIEGWDLYTGQNVAFIYRQGLIEYARKEQTWEMFSSKEYHNIHKHLFARFQWPTGSGAVRILIANVHLTADAAKSDTRVKQSRLIRAWIANEIKAGENVIVLGDLNTQEISGQTQPQSDLATLIGMDTKNQDDDLIDLHLQLKPDDRDTHAAGRQLDRILISRSLLDDQRKTTDLSFVQVGNFRDHVVVGARDFDHFNRYYKIPREERDVSDHYPIMVEFQIK